MNIKALITTLFVVGSSSVALAQPAPQRVVEVRETPATVVQRRYEHAPVVVERTYAPAPIVVERTYAPAPIVIREHRAPSWSLLSSSDQIAPSGRTKIGLGDSELRTLKLQSTGGKTTVSEVAIKFADGQTQVVYPQTALANGGAYTIDLNGNVRSVASIVVYGRSSHDASFEVLGA